MYIIDIDPKPYVRPRVNTITRSAYNTKDYKDYKTTLTWLIAQKKIPKSIYGELQISFYLKRPKSKSKVLQNHQVKPDLDNLIKAFMDALENSGVIKNDSNFHSIIAMKRYGEVPKIEFELKE